MADIRLLLCVVFIFILFPLPESKTGITFLDVGQGDGIFIESGEDILIDCGSSSTSKIGKNTLEPFLESKGKGKLESVFVTHSDADHINGIKYLLSDSDIHIGELYLPSCARGHEKYDELVRLAEERETKVTYIEKGWSKELKYGKLTCLSPEKGEDPEEINDHSIVLKYESGDFSALLMGDAGEEVEKRIVSEGLISGATVLKCGHHGSRSSSCSEFLKASDPVISILSYGEGNRYKHPNEETLDRLRETDTLVLRTADCGAISFYTDGEKISVKRFIKQDIN